MNVLNNMVLPLMKVHDMSSENGVDDLLKELIPPIDKRLVCVSHDELPESGQLGDVAIIVGTDGNSTYMWVDGWVILGDTDNTTDVNKDDGYDEWVIVDANCKNCGAPVDTRDEKCEYCGTPYLKMKKHYY